MTIEAWFIFAGFWLLFVTTPGPNAVNCVSVAMAYGFRTSLVCVLGILMQATLFLIYGFSLGLLSFTRGP